MFYCVSRSTLRRGGGRGLWQRPLLVGALLLPLLRLLGWLGAGRSKGQVTSHFCWHMLVPLWTSCFWVAVNSCKFVALQSRALILSHIEQHCTGGRGRLLAWLWLIRAHQSEPGELAISTTRPVLLFPTRFEHKHNCMLTSSTLLILLHLEY